MCIWLWIVDCGLWMHFLFRWKLMTHWDLFEDRQSVKKFKVLGPFQQIWQLIYLTGFDWIWRNSLELWPLWMTGRLIVWPYSEKIRGKRREKREKREECTQSEEIGRGIDRGVRREDKNIQKGMKTNRNLSQRRVERLEEIGFQWKGRNGAFEKRCRDLIAFKEEYGDCNVPQKYANNSSLGHW